MSVDLPSTPHVSSSLPEHISSILQCNVCFVTFSDDHRPLRLQCSHNMGEQCFEELALLEIETTECPAAALKLRCPTCSCIHRINSTRVINHDILAIAKYLVPPSGMRKDAPIRPSTSIVSATFRKIQSFCCLRRKMETLTSLPPSPLSSLPESPKESPPIPSSPDVKTQPTIVYRLPDLEKASVPRYLVKNVLSDAESILSSPPPALSISLTPLCGLLPPSPLSSLLQSESLDGDDSFGFSGGFLAASEEEEDVFRDSMDPSNPLYHQDCGSNCYQQEFCPHSNYC